MRIPPNTILLFQKKAVRMCINLFYRDYSNPFFLKLETLKVNDINILQIRSYLTGQTGNTISETPKQYWPAIPFDTHAHI